MSGFVSAASVPRPIDRAYRGRPALSHSTAAVSCITPRSRRAVRCPERASPACLRRYPVRRASPATVRSLPLAAPPRAPSEMTTVEARAQARPHAPSRHWSEPARWSQPPWRCARNLLTLPPKSVCHMHYSWHAPCKSRASSGCKLGQVRPATGPAGNNRNSHGGNERGGAFDYVTIIVLF